MMTTAGNLMKRRADMADAAAFQQSPGHRIPAGNRFVADQQLQLFQPFHLWHTVPGFCFATCFIAFQKAASLAIAFLLTVFFILFSPPCLTIPNLITKTSRLRTPPKPFLMNTYVLPWSLNFPAACLSMNQVTSPFTGRTRPAG
jgi:hypothetical protein